MRAYYQKPSGFSEGNIAFTMSNATHQKNALNNMKHHKTDRGMDGSSTAMRKIMDSPFKSPRCILYQNAFRIYEENAIDWYKNEPYEMWFLNDINEYTG